MRGLIERAVERAAKVTEDFHGRRIKWVRDVDEPYSFRAVHAVLGRMVAIRFMFRGEVKEVNGFDKNTMLVTVPEATSLYILGGDQTIDLAALGLEPAKDDVYLGEAASIVYFTRKGFHDFEPTEYEHAFGEVDRRPDLLESWQRRRQGERPHLRYDALSRRLHLVGGAYTVHPEGIIH
jgi:hypothetical protein